MTISRQSSQSGFLKMKDCWCIDAQLAPGVLGWHCHSFISREWMMRRPTCWTAVFVPARGVLEGGCITSLAMSLAFLSRRLQGTRSQQRNSKADLVARGGCDKGTLEKTSSKVGFQNCAFKAVSGLYISISSKVGTPTYFTLLLRAFNFMHRTLRFSVLLLEFLFSALPCPFNPLLTLGRTDFRPQTLDTTINGLLFFSWPLFLCRKALVTLNFNPRQATEEDKAAQNSQQKGGKMYAQRDPFRCQSGVQQSPIHIKHQNRCLLASRKIPVEIHSSLGQRHRPNDSIDWETLSDNFPSLRY